MQKIHFTTHKVAHTLPLERVAQFFCVRQPLKWEQYISLDSSHISSILKYDSEGKIVYLFQFGCISFINFSWDEVQSFLQYISLIVDEIDYHLSSMFHENYELQVDSSGHYTLSEVSNKLEFNDKSLDILSIVMAKSVELDKMNTDVSQLLDDAEIFVLYMQKGQFRPNNRKFKKTILDVLKLYYYSIHGAGIFDNNIYRDQCVRSIETYNNAMDYYEIMDRFRIFQKKIDSLQRTVKSYSTLSYKHYGLMLYLAEVFLLASAPLFYVIAHMS